LRIRRVFEILRPEGFDFTVADQRYLLSAVRKFQLVKFELRVFWTYCLPDQIRWASLIFYCQQVIPEDFIVKNFIVTNPNETGCSSGLELKSKLHHWTWVIKNLRTRTQVELGARLLSCVEQFKTSAGAERDRRCSNCTERTA